MYNHQYQKRTRLEEAEKEWEEQTNAGRDTVMEQSLAATMSALEAPFGLPTTPRRSRDSNDEEIDVSQTTPSPAQIKTPMYRTTGGEFTPVLVLFS